MENKGFKIEVSSRYDGFWRYNMALTCGCFDAEENRTGFVSAASHVADVGSGLTQPPADLPAPRKLTLVTEPCDHLSGYLYVIPHTLPVDNDIDATRPFDIELRISYAGQRLRTEKRRINQWSGASVELRIGREE